MLGAHFSDLHPYFAAPTAQAVLAENKPASQLTADYATVWLALLAGCAPSSQDIFTISDALISFVSMKVSASSMPFFTVSLRDRRVPCYQHI